MKRLGHASSWYRQRYLGRGNGANSAHVQVPKLLVGTWPGAGASGNVPERPLITRYQSGANNPCSAGWYSCCKQAFSCLGCRLYVVIRMSIARGRS